MTEYIRPEYRSVLHSDPAHLARSIKRDLDASGLATVTDFFTEAAVERMRAEALSKHEYCLGSETRKPLIGDDLQGTVFYEMAKSDWVQSLSNIILRPFGYQVDKDDVYPAMNILLGAKSRDGIYGYHFDATFLTFAVPVVMPPPGDRGGAFRIWPNVRSFSTGWASNKWYCRIMRIRKLRDRFRSLAVHFRPGDLYAFYGFRSWHGVEDLDEESLRTNCLLNVGGPYFHKSKNRGLLPRDQRAEP